MGEATAQQLSFPFHIFEEEVMNPLGGLQMTEQEIFIAGLILEASSEKPIKMEEIISRFEDNFRDRLTVRQLKIIVRSFRRDRAFPILSRRSQPAGYWWCQSIEEMKEFAQLWQSQYFDEMRTLYVMMKHNFPRLAGQLRLPQVSKE